MIRPFGDIQMYTFYITLSTAESPTIPSNQNDII